MKKLLFNILSAGFGIWLAVKFVPGIQFKLLPDSNFFGIGLTADWQFFLLFGIILGLLNYFAKPILKVLSLPLEIITLGLFTFVINMGLVWIVDIIFKELYIPLWLPLLYTSLIIWGIALLFNIISREN